MDRVGVFLDPTLGIYGLRRNYKSSKLYAFSRLKFEFSLRQKFYKLYKLYIEEIIVINQAHVKR